LNIRPKISERPTDELIEIANLQLKFGKQDADHKIELVKKENFGKNKMIFF
jgi:hypothetical protein